LSDSQRNSGAPQNCSILSLFRVGLGRTISSHRGAGGILVALKWGVGCRERVGSWRLLLCTSPSTVGAFSSSHALRALPLRRGTQRRLDCLVAGGLRGRACLDAAVTPAVHCCLVCMYASAGVHPLLCLLLLLVCTMHLGMLALSSWCSVLPLAAWNWLLGLRTGGRPFLTRRTNWQYERARGCWEGVGARAAIAAAVAGLRFMVLAR
jgi:hypothetical protein